MEQELTFCEAVKKKTAGTFKEISVDKQKDYNHVTFSISNVSEYIHLIEKISSTRDIAMCYDDIIYRGIADYRFDLRPGLARIDTNNEGMELDLMNLFLTRRPDAFVDLKPFDRMAKMQHYGLPTRLLDFTLNPLVALFFACETKPSIDGRVVCHGTFLQNDTSLFLNKVCNVICTKPYDICTVDDFFCDQELTVKKYLFETCIVKETMVIQPKYWNRRIANQAGVFMMFHNALVDLFKNVLIHEREIGLDKSIEEYARGNLNRTALITALTREPIDYYRKDKDHYVTREYFNKMYDAYKDDKELFWSSVKRRFRVDDKLRVLDDHTKTNSFCSIIIRKDYKKRIIKELSDIGIREDYIYPELEYTAKDIKRKYLKG